MAPLSTPSTRAATALELPALQIVRSPRAVRSLAYALIALLTLLPILLVAVPWQQNVSASGRVTAYDPLDRMQTIPAPVTGRLVELHVQDGSFVSEGDVLAVLSDQDVDYVARLEQQRQFAMEKVRASKDVVQYYDTQLVHLEDVREQAVSAAEFELEVAIQKVRAAEQELTGAEAEHDQKLADRDRKWTLWTKKVASELDFQKAEADYLAAKAKVEGAKAKVEQARNEELAKMASVGKVAGDQRAKIESIKSSREDARSKVALAEKELTEAQTKVERQKSQVVRAPRDGFVLRVHAATTADLLSQGQPLIEFIPETGELAVELWTRGIDAPLIAPGRKVRLQFEGWPAVQFAGWPAVAVGTFGGVVASVDAQAGPDGRFRTLVLPDPDDEPWPERRYLRQGVRTNGWVLLDTVSIGYEIWRQLNAFPPSVSGAPAESTGPAPAAPKAGKKKG